MRSSAMKNGLNNARTNGAPMAALHQQEGHWRLVIARHKDRWEVLESRTLLTADAASLAPLFAQHGVSQLIRVVPGRETVVRCLPIPAGDETALLAAVSLLAEAELPATLPVHRRGAGILP